MNILLSGIPKFNSKFSGEFCSILIIHPKSDYIFKTEGLRCLEEAKAFIEKHGIPEDFKKKIINKALQNHQPSPVIKEYLRTASDGRQYIVSSYSLDMMLAIGIVFYL